MPPDSPRSTISETTVRTWLSDEADSPVDSPAELPTVFQAEPPINIPETLTHSRSRTQRRQTDQREHDYTIIVMGAKGAGQTSLINRYVNRKFSEEASPTTCGADVKLLKALKFVGNGTDAHRSLNIKFLDIPTKFFYMPGKTWYDHMTRTYYEGAEGALILYDLTRAATLEPTTRWKNDVDAKVKLADGSSLPSVLVGTKSDLHRDLLLPPKDQIHLNARNNGFVGHYEASSKSNMGVEDALRCLITKVLEDEDRILECEGQLMAESQVESRSRCNLC